MPKLGVVIFGASSFDNHQDLNNPRFASAVKEFKKVICDATLTRGRDTHILDLYNKPLLPSDVVTKITDFIGNDYDDFIVYYCGHGDVGRREGDYRVFLKLSNRHRRNGTLLHIAGLIRDVQVTLERKRVYFILDACYSGSAINEMETMDAGGAEQLIDRSIAEAMEGGHGMAVFAASGRLAVALAKLEDRSTLFTGAFTKCLRDGIALKSELSSISWWDIRDEIIRSTRDRLGPDAPVPKLTSFSEAAVDITRTPFFNNRAYVPRRNLPDDTHWGVSERTSEHLYWKNLSEDSPAVVLEDFLTKFPNGLFAQLARGFLAKRVETLGEAEIERYLREHKESHVKQQLVARVARLRWERVKNSSNVAELEQLIAAFPQCEVIDDIRSRINAVEQHDAERQKRWLEIEGSRDPAVFDQFLKDFPNGPFEQPARDRRAALLAEQSSTNSSDEVALPLGIMTAEPAAPLRSTGSAWRWVAGALLLVVAVVVTWVLKDMHSSARLDADMQALNRAGTDLEALRAFVESCKARPSCTLKGIADSRIDLASKEQTRARSDADRKGLENAGNDIGKLRAFLDRCKTPSCAYEALAMSNLERAEGSDVEAAAFDVARLQACVQQCRSSSARASAESRLAIVRAEENAYRAARNNANLLQRYGSECKVCKFKSAALTEAAELNKQKPSTGFNVTVGFDMVGGDIASPDFMIRDIDAGSCHARCQATNGCIAYSYDKWKRSCYLKDKLVALTFDPRSDTGIRRDQSVPGVLGNAKRFCRSSLPILGDGPPAFSSATASACEQNCESDQNCVAYVFRATDMQCKLLRSTSDRQKGPGSANIIAKYKTQTSC